MEKFKIIFATMLLLFCPVFVSAQVIEELAQSAEVILVVEAGQVGECKKYCWQEVKIVKELKNPLNYQLNKTLNIAFYSWDEGIPSGISTVYLEKYNPDRNDLWKLVGGKRETGVSPYKENKNP